MEAPSGRALSSGDLDQADAAICDRGGTASPAARSRRPPPWCQLNCNARRASPGPGSPADGLRLTLRVWLRLTLRVWLAGVQVHDGGHAEPALAGRDVGQVGQPDLVRHRCRERAVQQVGGNRASVATIGGLHAPPLGDKATAAYQPLNPAPAHPSPAGPERCVHARTAVTAPLVACAVRISSSSARFFGRALALRPGTPGVEPRGSPDVVAGGRNLQPPWSACGTGTGLKQATAGRGGNVAVAADPASCPYRRTQRDSNV